MNGSRGLYLGDCILNSKVWYTGRTRKKLFNIITPPKKAPVSWSFDFKILEILAKKRGKNERFSSMHRKGKNSLYTLLKSSLVNEIL